MGGNARAGLVRGWHPRPVQGDIGRGFSYDSECLLVRAMNGSCIRVRVRARLIGKDLVEVSGYFAESGWFAGQRDVVSDPENISHGQFPGKFSRVAEPPPDDCFWLLWYYFRHGCQTRPMLMTECEH